MLSNKVWQVTPRISQDAFQKLDSFPPLAAQLLHNRGITDSASAKIFLASDARLLENPLLLPDMGKAISRIKTALLTHELIGVFGDFDADGITGTALLSEGLENMGGKIMPYLPHRVKEGHGLSSQAVDAFHKQGVTLIITVDCGITSPREVAEATALGIDIIITDHHTPSTEIPAAQAIVNPKLSSSEYPFPHLAGVGLAFKLVHGLSEHLRQDWDESLLQLAALGTVTDVTPLLGENRYIVATGLHSMNTNLKPGLKELLNLSGQTEGSLDTESISFIFGPRINAPGRIKHAMSSYNLLRSSSREEAIPLALELDSLNRERQNMTRKALDSAIKYMNQRDTLAKGRNVPLEHILFLSSDEFTPGIVGLLASRLVEEHYKPSVVIAIDGDVGRGSARSITEFNMAAALEECSDLFTSFGGHPMAAGFIVPKNNIQYLHERLLHIAQRELSHLSLQPTINIDAHVRLTSLTGDNLQFLQALAPYGEGNPTPIFITKNVKVIDVVRLGNQKQHLRLKLKENQALWDAMAFGQAERWQEKTDSLDVVYKLGLNHWRGQTTLRMIIQDFRPA